MLYPQEVLVLQLLLVDAILINVLIFFAIGF